MSTLPAEYDFRHTLASFNLASSGPWQPGLQHRPATQVRMQGSKKACILLLVPPLARLKLSLACLHKLQSYFRHALKQPQWHKEMLSVKGYILKLCATAEVVKMHKCMCRVKVLFLKIHTHESGGM